MAACAVGRQYTVRVCPESELYYALRLALNLAVFCRSVCVFQFLQRESFLSGQPNGPWQTVFLQWNRVLHAAAGIVLNHPNGHSITS